MTPKLVQIGFSPARDVLGRSRRVLHAECRMRTDMAAGRARQQTHPDGTEFRIMTEGVQLLLGWISFR